MGLRRVVGAASPTPAQIARVARSVLTKNLGIRPGERVGIEAWTYSLPWAIGFAREARRLGASPLMLYEDEAAYWDSVRSREEAILGKVARHEWAALGATDAYVFFWGPADRTPGLGLPDKRTEQLTAYNEEWYAAARKAGLRGVRMELGRVCPPMAKLWGVDETRWRDELAAATTYDPAELRKAARPLERALARGRSVHLTHPNGTDLSLKLAGLKPRVITGGSVPRKQRGSYGMMATAPAGVVMAALDPRTAEGTVVGNRPAFFYKGRTDRPELTFRGGKLVKYSFGDGEKIFKDSWNAGRGTKDRPGYLSVGLNPHVHGLPMVEDVERGVVLVSLGNNTFVGGSNRSNFFQYALVGGGTLELDGRTVVDRGEVV